MWIDINEEQPVTDNLVLVLQDMTGRCLRYRTESGDWYDENEIYDDSELEITHWAEIEPVLEP